MDTPHHFGGNVPHWSRWERGATSFGPRGRLIATGVIVAVVIASLFSGFFVTSLAAMLAAVVLLQDIWKRDWIVPDEPRLPVRPSEERRAEAADPPSRSHTAYRYAGWTTIAALAMAFA